MDDDFVNEEKYLTYTKIPLALCLLAGLAACGGSSNPGASNLRSDFNALLSDFEDVEATAPRDVPTRGSAGFRGVAGYIVGSEDDLIDELENLDPETFSARSAHVLSDIRINVDYGNETVSGSARNFENARNGRSLGGRLNIDGELFEGGGEVGYLGEVTGQMPDRSGNVASVRDGLIAGAFGGRDADVTGGILLGERRAGRDSIFVGVFVAD